MGMAGRCGWMENERSANQPCFYQIETGRSACDNLVVKKEEHVKLNEVNGMNDRNEMTACE